MVEEIKYPSPMCEVGGAHYFIQLHTEIWRCRKCWVAKWQPATWAEADALSWKLRGSKKIQEVYNYALKRKPMVKRVLVKLEEIRIARKHMSSEDFLKLAKKMSMTREFKNLETGR